MKDTEILLNNKKNIFFEVEHKEAGRFKTIAQHWISYRDKNTVCVQYGNNKQWWKATVVFLYNVQAMEWSRITNGGLSLRAIFMLSYFLYVYIYTLLGTPACSTVKRGWQVYFDKLRVKHDKNLEDSAVAKTGEQELWEA